MRLRTIGLSAALAALVIGGLVWVNRDHIAVALAPKKVAAQTRSESARQADEVFWQTLHGGQYDSIGKALEVLTPEYLKTPDDAVTPGGCLLRFGTGQIDARIETQLDRIAQELLGEQS